MIYSGKGGVGKTTTTANLAKCLRDRGKKILVIDADIVTPSMNLFLPEKSENITVISNGYRSSLAVNMFQTTSSIKSFFNKCKQVIKNNKFDYVLIDTPPSLTDIHAHLLSSIKLSSVLLVSQPNQKSIQDIESTYIAFSLRKIPIMGMIINMDCVELREDFTTDISVLGVVPMSTNIEPQVYSFVCNKIEELDPVKQLEEQNIALMFDDKITVKDIKALIETKGRNALMFYNLRTWDFVVHEIKDSEYFEIMPVDKLIEVNTTQVLERFINHCKDNGTFYIKENPNLDYKFYEYEIITGTLCKWEDKNYYGLPYLLMSNGVRLFPHELGILTNDDLINLQNDEDLILTKDNRMYINY